MKAWLQELRLSHLLVLLAALALLGVAGAVVSRGGARRNEAASSFLGRSLDYGRYERDEETRLTDLELWDKKVHDGFTRNQAMVYVSNRPGRASSATPTDSSALLVSAARHEQRVGRTEARLGLLAAVLSVIGISAAVWIRIEKPHPG